VFQDYLFIILNAGRNRIKRVTTIDTPFDQKAEIILFFNEFFGHCFFDHHLLSKAEPQKVYLH
jgi:hypothetical protein